MKENDLLNKLFDLIKPIVVELNYELYHIEYVKEQEEYYLRIYIDSPNGISLKDCEKVSRAISEMLDIKDPIPDSYYLEVSSPGINRVLFNDKHLQTNINNLVLINFSKLYKGKKSFEGILKEFNDNEIVVTSAENDEFLIPRSKIKNIILKGEC